MPILGNYFAIRRKLEAARDKGEPIPLAQEEQLWEEAHTWGAERLASTIGDLKGFYVKRYSARAGQGRAGREREKREVERDRRAHHTARTSRFPDQTNQPTKPPTNRSGQVISTRVDMFPKQYTDRLQTLQDSVDPIPASVVKAVVRQDLLEGEPLSVMFKEFDDTPLGSASIAQVHRAVLVDGRQVAVKVQRPSEEPKLRGDIGNLKAFSKRFRASLPVDYYKARPRPSTGLFGQRKGRASGRTNGRNE